MSETYEVLHVIEHADHTHTTEPYLVQAYCELDAINQVRKLVAASSNNDSIIAERFEADVAILY